MKFYNTYLNSYNCFFDILGLAAVNKFYPLLIENLPSNHLISLLRLHDIAFVPEEIVDSIIPSLSAEIGNKMIINYLIGLIHTEEHIITFCRFVRKMIREFDNCVPVLNLQNCKLKIMQMYTYIRMYVHITST